MNKSFTLTFGVTLLLWLFSTTPLLFSQVQVSVEKKDAMYRIGQTANFQIRSNSGGSLTYEISYDNRTEAIESGSINVSANQTYTLPYRQSEPGVVFCKVSGAAGADVAAVSFAPLDIAPLEAEPSDFDQYWNAQKAQVRNLSTNPQIAVFRNNANSTTYTLSLPNLGGRRIYGYMTVPKGNGPFPAAIIYPAFGASAASTSTEVDVAETGGLIAISLSVHNTPVTQSDPNAYEPDNTSNREEIYYRYALTGGMNVINYLQTRPDFDKRNICAMGVSQGGGLAMLLAGIDNRVNTMINSNPAMNEHQGHKYKQASGFPYYLSDVLLSVGGQGTYNAAATATKYYDAVYANRRFKGSSYTLIGLEDDVVPAATSFAGYNQLRGQKILMLSRDGGHGHPGEYWNGRYDFLRRHYQLTPPFQFAATTKGYQIEAGNNTQVATNTALNLRATVQLEAQNLSNLPAQWKKISGPGAANFSNASSYSTTVSFSQAGTYVLQFLAQDNKKLDSEGKMYFLSDDITITVGGGGTTGGGTTGGGTTGGGTTGGGTTGGGTTGGNTASTLTINCPSSITINAAAGQNSAIANWATPTANSTCSQGSGGCSTNISGFTYMGQANQSNFFISNQTFKWKEAEADAKQRGGTMAIINSQAENDLIQGRGEIVYIGLSDEEREGTFKWADGSSVGFSNFQADVSNTANLDYIAVNHWDGTWAYYDNIVSKKYILEIPCGGTTSGGATIRQQGGLSSGSAFPIGTTTINYQATDPCGNTETCSFSVTVNATAANLNLTCPANQTVQLSAGVSQAQVTWQNPTTSTNCSGNVQLNQLSGPTSNSFLAAKNYLVSYEATDNCNNRKTCSFRVDVIAANTNINMSCSRDLTFQLPTGQRQRSVNWEAPNITTTCGGDIVLTQTGGPAPNSLLSAGTVQVTYEARDNCGNSTTCSFDITIIEATAAASPTTLSLTCPANRTIEISTTENGKTVNWSAPQVSTTCTIGGNTNCAAQTITGHTYLGKIGQSHYYLSNAETDWEEAVVEATKTGGYLVKIESEEENSRLQEFINSGYVYIGLNDKQEEGTFKWTDGTALGYSNYVETTSNSIYNNYILFNGWKGTWSLTGNNVHKRYVVEIPCASSTSFQQSEGPTNGNFLPIGTTRIGYVATDACANTDACSFTITIKKSTTPIGDCSNPSDGGTIAATENKCEPFQATILAELFTPIGLSEEVEYAWLRSTSTCPNSLTQRITGADKEFYDPGFIQQTTYFTRWMRVKGCTEWKKSNCVVKQVSACGGDAPTSSTSCLVKPQAVELTTGTTIGGNLRDIINGTGLSGEVATATHESGRLYDGVWLNDGTKPVLEFDLGTARLIDGLLLWNYSYHEWMVLKRRGVKDFAISTSTDGVRFSAETRFKATATTAAGIKEKGQFFALPTAITAKVVRLRVINAQNDASYVGIGEVRFTNNCGLRSLEETTDITTSNRSTAINNTELSHSVSTLKANDLRLSPNPSTGRFSIELPHQAEDLIRISIYNELGKEVYFQQFDDQQLTVTITLEQYPPGIYLVRVTEGAKAFSLKKIIIQ